MDSGFGARRARVRSLGETRVPGTRDTCFQFLVFWGFFSGGWEVFEGRDMLGVSVSGLGLGLGRGLVDLTRSSSMYLDLFFLASITTITSP